MYPELFRIPWIDYPVSSFGVLMAIAFLVGYAITTVRLEEEGFDTEPASSRMPRKYSRP